MAWRSRRNLLDVGARAPDFTLKALDGRDVTTTVLLSESALLLAFFKVSCPVCQFTLPFLDRLHREGPGTSIRIYGVSQNDARSTQEFNREFKIGFPALLDPEKSFETSNLLGVSTVPTILLIGQDRTVEWVSEGFSRADLETLASRVGARIFRDGERIPEYRPG